MIRGKYTALPMLETKNLPCRGVHRHKNLPAFGGVLSVPPGPEGLALSPTPGPEELALPPFPVVPGLVELALFWQLEELDLPALGEFSAPADWGSRGGVCPCLPTLAHTLAPVLTTVSLKSSCTSVLWSRDLNFDLVGRSH